MLRVLKEIRSPAPAEDLSGGFGAGCPNTLFAEFIRFQTRPLMLWFVRTITTVNDLGRSGPLDTRGPKKHNLP